MEQREQVMLFEYEMDQQLMLLLLVLMDIFGLLNMAGFMISFFPRPETHSRKSIIMDGIDRMVRQAGIIKHMDDDFI